MCDIENLHDGNWKLESRDKGKCLTSKRTSNKRRTDGGQDSRGGQTSDYGRLDGKHRLNETKRGKARWGMPVLDSRKHENSFESRMEVHGTKAKWKERGKTGTGTGAQTKVLLLSGEGKDEAETKITWAAMGEESREGTRGNQVKAIKERVRSVAVKRGNPGRKVRQSVGNLRVPGEGEGREGPCWHFFKAIDKKSLWDD